MKGYVLALLYSQAMASHMLVIRTDFMVRVPAVVIHLIENCEYRLRQRHSA